MASDSQDSRRKHSRSSSDDESPETSKRHKYRHHRHHLRRHRHHHRHSSKKHGDEKKDEIHAESKREVEDLRGIAPISADYDMEEGEIVEEESIVATDVEIAHKKFESDVESGEFRDFEGPSEFDDSHMRGVADMVSLEANHSLPSADNNGRCGKTPKSLGSDVGDGSKKHRSPCHDGEPPLLESVVNGDSDLKFSKIESTSHTRHKSPSKGSSKHKLHRESESKQRSLDIIDMDENENGKQRNLSSYRYHMETSDRSRSASPDHTREREHSQSVLLDKHVRMRHRHGRDEQLYDNGKDPDELDDERDSRISTDSRFDSNDKAKGRRERSSSQHRSSMLGSKDEHADYRDIEGEENMYKDDKRMKEQVKSRERNERDNGRNRVLEKERNCGGGRDRDRDKEPDRDRGKLREMKSDMGRDTERDRERRRDRYRGWSRDGDLDRDKRRDDTITTYKDRDTEEWDDRLDDRDRKLEMDRGRDRHSSRERHRDRYRDVERDRSRRYYKYDDRDDGYGNHDRHRGYDESKYHRDRERRSDLGKNRASKDDSLMDNLDVNRDDDDQKDYQERVDLELAGQEEDDADRIKEQSRRLREAILQKYKAQKSQHETMPQSTKAPSEESEEQTFKNVVMMATVQENIKIKRDSQDSGAGETSFDLGKSPSNNDATAAVTSAGAGGLGEGTPKSERSNDMFCDDIFGESPAGVRKMGKGDGLPVERSGLHDNWDDPEGYYSFRFGEILDSRYEITAAHGKGVFSTVVRAKDLKAGAGDPEEVAIKIIRNNETMLKAGTEELVILKKLVGADQDDRRHCVRYLSHFKYRNHLCIVFESLHMNLREVLKKFGRNIGLKLTAVRAYAKQLFIALKHLRNCGVLHCDIKPDNMLVNDAKNVLKLCDFGNAMFAGKNEVTPYLVSRFYRAPEIILGLPYDHPMDIWSVGCCLYELYTGKVLFPGPTNNDMLRLHMELKGPFPKKMLRKGAFVEKHFDTNLNFLAIEEDPVTKKPIRRAMVNIKPKDVGTIIKGSSGEDPKMLTNFKDLLEKIFALDPEKRFTVSQALNHPFITDSNHWAFTCLSYLPHCEHKDGGAYFWLCSSWTEKADVCREVTYWQFPMECVQFLLKFPVDWGNPSMFRCLEGTLEKVEKWNCIKCLERWSTRARKHGSAIALPFPVPETSPIWETSRNTVADRRRDLSA